MMITFPTLYRRADDGSLHALEIYTDGAVIVSRRSSDSGVSAAQCIRTPVECGDPRHAEGARKMNAAAADVWRESLKKGYHRFKDDARLSTPRKVTI